MRSKRFNNPTRPLTTERRTEKDHIITPDSIVSTKPIPFSKTLHSNPISAIKFPYLRMILSIELPTFSSIPSTNGNLTLGSNGALSYTVPFVDPTSTK